LQDSTYALTLFRKNAELDDGTSAKVDFWDTAGQERFNSMHPSYYYQAHICILVFDVTRKQTYKQVSVAIARSEAMSYGWVLFDKRDRWRSSL